MSPFFRCPPQVADFPKPPDLICRKHKTSFRAFFPDLNLFTLKKFAEIFSYRYNTKTRGGFLEFFKNPRARLLPGVSGVGELFGLIVSRGGFYGFVINQRVQLAVFVRRAAGVFI